MTVTINGTSGITTPSPVVLQGSTSGTITLAAPAIAGGNTATLPLGTGTIVVRGVSTNISAGAVVTASGTSVDITGIPAYAKRVSILLNGISFNATAVALIQLGTVSGVETTVYTCTVGNAGGAVGSTSTAGFILTANASAIADLSSGIVTLANITGNTWVESGTLSLPSGPVIGVSTGSKALAGVLDRIRVTTVAGTAAFDAGTINVFWE